MAKKATAETKELTVTQGNMLPAEFSMEEDAGMGFENMRADDLAIPFLMILQSGSPQLKRGEQQIEGAAEGDIFNSVTNAFWNGNEGIYVIPCAYKKAFVEWTPRSQGGGFVRQYDTDEILAQTHRNDKGQDELPNGNIIVTTAYHYVLCVDPLSGDYSEAVISMSSTQLKKSRKWNSIMQGLKLPRKDGTRFTPPMFSHIYKLTTVPESNELGSWSGWKIELFSQVPTIELYEAAKLFASNVSKGLVKEAVPIPESDSDKEPLPF